MGMVSRRRLQKILSENAAFLTPREVQTLVDALNRSNRDSLSAEYEVLLLNAFHKLGHVEYEAPGRGPRRLDLLFSPTSIPGLLLTADITTVSDAGLKEENPAEHLWREFGKLLRRHGLSGAGFSGRVEGALAGVRGDQKMILAIPPKKDIPRLVRRLTPFVRSVAKTPEKPTAVKLDEVGISLSISYQPGDRSSGWSHFSFRVPYSLTRNPVANRLKAKARQVKGSGVKGITGVLLCDGDCDILRGLSSSTAHFSERDIVSHFFKLNTSISFVVFLTVRESYSSFSTPTQPHFQATAFSNPWGQFPCPAELLKLLELIPTLLPTPLQGPANALHQYAWEQHSGLSFYGGFHMADREIRLSARALTQLLAGRVELERFRKDHHFVPSRPGEIAIDFFADQLKDGRTIESVRIESTTEDDDDWIVFVFGAPDPAISPFRSE